MFHLRAVCKEYHGTPVLGPIDLDIGPGTTVLIGPSGCGKSTLLRLLIALIRPNAGEVRFEGQDLWQQHLRSVRRKMGYVIQDGGLFPHLSAAQNVLLLPRHVGWDATRRDR